MKPMIPRLALLNTVAKTIIIEQLFRLWLWIGGRACGAEADVQRG